MHNALSFPRLHRPKTTIIGYYAPGGYAAQAELDAQQDAQQAKHEEDLGVNPKETPGRRLQGRSKTRQCLSRCMCFCA